MGRHRWWAGLGFVVATLTACEHIPVPPPPPPTTVVDEPGRTRQPFCGFDGIVHALAHTDGGTVVGGEFVTATGAAGTSVARPGLARCLDDGTVDAAFDPGLAPSVYALATTPSWLYVGGTFDITVDGVRYRRVARLDPTTGTLDATWRPQVAGSVRALAVGSDGAVFVGGNITRVNGQPVTRLAKLDPGTGALDPGFAATVDHTDGWENVLSLHPHSSGDLFVGGTFETINGVARASAARLDATSGSVLPFAPDLADSNPNDPKVQVTAIVEHAGAVHLCGDWWQTEGIGSQADQRNIGRFDPVTGAADLEWLPSIGRGLQSCALDATTDNLLVGGDHTLVDGAPVGAVHGIGLSTGTVDTSWLPDPVTSVGIKALLVTDDAVVLGGDIAAVDGEPAANAARATAG